MRLGGGDKMDKRRSRECYVSKCMAKQRAQYIKGTVNNSFCIIAVEGEWRERDVRWTWSHGQGKNYKDFLRSRNVGFIELCSVPNEEPQSVWSKGMTIRCSFQINSYIHVEDGTEKKHVIAEIPVRKYQSKWKILRLREKERMKHFSGGKIGRFHGWIDKGRVKSSMSCFIA